MRVLILGGTTEASELTRLLAADPRFQATVSLAGRTANPSAQPVPTRRSSFILSAVVICTGARAGIN